MGILLSCTQGSCVVVNTVILSCFSVNIIFRFVCSWHGGGFVPRRLVFVVYPAVLLLLDNLLRQDAKTPKEVVENNSGIKLVAIETCIA